LEPIDVALSIFPKPAESGYCFTTVPLRELSTLTSVAVEVTISVRYALPVFGLKELQRVTPWPVIGIIIDEALLPSTNLNTENPTAACVASMAFVPGIGDIENGYRNTVKYQ
jgi:hypothetical protein